MYQIADAEIRLCIKAYLELAKATKGFADVSAEQLADPRAVAILLAGLGAQKVEYDAANAVEEWRRRQAIPFDLEAAITAGVYRDIRSCGVRFLDQIEKATHNFTRFDAAFINQNPYLLPVLQHLSGIFSKAALKRQVGGVSDNAISKPAAERLAKLLRDRVVAADVNKGEILQRLESTLEGIVRDLVGRVLLESIVENALLESSRPI